MLDRARADAELPRRVRHTEADRALTDKEHTHTHENGEKYRPTDCTERRYLTDFLDSNDGFTLPLQREQNNPNTE